jgi:circadian clock protein KaiC
MFTAAITVGSISQNPSDEGISSMVDSWVMLQDNLYENERIKTMFVMKSRGMRHSKKEMQLLIDKSGISFVSSHAMVNA